MQAAKKAVAVLAISGALSAGMFLTSMRGLHTDPYVSQLSSMRHRKVTVSRDSPLYDESGVKRISVVKKGSQVLFRGRLVSKGKAFYRVLLLAPPDKIGTMPEESLNFSGIDKNFEIKELVDGPRYGAVQKFCDSFVGLFYDGIAKQRSGMRSSRVHLAVKLVYESGRQYEPGHTEFLRSLAENENEHKNMGNLLEHFSGFKDYRFADIIARRLHSGEITSS